jgi:hypothetical protein
MIFALIITFIVSHPGPAEHFAAFARELEDRNLDCTLIARDTALKKLENSGLNVIQFSEEALQAAAKSQLIFLEVCDVRMAELPRKLGKERCVAYYDNPEKEVPGGYKDNAKKVIEAAGRVIYAIEDLGYYPVEKVEEFRKMRISQAERKEAFFRDQGIKNPEGKKAIVFFGSANSAYYEGAFPRLLEILEKVQGHLPNHLFILQRHPRSSIEAGSKLPSGVIVTDDKFAFDDAVALADVALYYQTSAAPQFVLAGIPTLQVAHEVNADLLIRNRVCQVATTPEEFIDCISQVSVSDPEKVSGLLGIRSDWKERLYKTVQQLLTVEQ